MDSTEKTLRIKQIKSKIGYAKDQHDTLRSLGLRHIGDVVEHADNPSIRGMILKVRHLVSVEEI